MADIIQNLIHNTLGDGARATKFSCVIILPPEISGQDPLAMDILCKVAQIPGKQIEVIDFKYRGKSIPVMGQEKFNQTLDITFYLEEDHNTKIMFEKWLSGLTADNYSNNLFSESKSIANTPGYVDTLTLHQLDFTGEKIMTTYEFKNIFPKEISAVNVDSTQVDTILEYNISFSYSHYDIISPNHSISSSDLANSIINGVQGAVNDVVKSVVGGVKDAVGTSVNSAAKQVNSGIDNIGLNFSEFTRLLK